MTTILTIDCYSRIPPLKDDRRFIYRPPQSYVMGTVVPQFSRMDPFHNGWKIMYEFD